jgi:serine/threonine protein kinase
MLRSPRLRRSTALTIDGSDPGSTPAAFGPFRVLHQVGAGTTGLVFRAHDPIEGRLVAIKAFRLDLPPERAAELAHALHGLAERGLSHPSIATPIGAGVEGGVAWFAQAYVPAESLDSALRQYGPPPVADALAIITHLAGALDFAAAAGVVHGSLHPRDVLVAPGETHLVDIGVASALESCGVRAPVRRPYSAPERNAGRSISRAGDIFALGAIAFELLSGYPVTGAGDDVVAGLPDVPGAHREALLETFSFALALAPDERYATALAFAAPLKKALGDALTRPPVPRKRRTPRPPEAVLPISGLEPEPMPAPSAGVPAVEFPADTAGASAETAFPAPPVPATRRSPTTLERRQADYEDARVQPGSVGRASRPPVPHEPVRDDDAPAYISGPTEPEPSAPAVEPIAAPGEWSTVSPVDPAPRFARLDEDVNSSPLEGVELIHPAETVRRWDTAEHDLPGHEAQPAVDDTHRRRGRDSSDEDLGRAFRDASPFTAPGVYGAEAEADVPFEPPAGSDATAPFEGATDAESRRAWLGLAAMLLVGLVAGLAAGWFLFGGRGDRTSARAGLAAAPANADAGGARPRDFTDGAVRQPAGAASAAGRTPAPPPAASKPAAGPRTEAKPPVAAAVRPTASPDRGHLVVRTRPAGARVDVGGRSRGESPATINDLPYGPHTVRVSREGYVTEQRRVTLSAHKPTQTIDVTLRKVAAPAPAPARAAAREPSTFVGTLVIESRPVGAKVFIDGRLVGVTPVTTADVQAGSHVVRLEMTGYRRWSTSVRVVAGERDRVAASLEEEPAR